VSKIIIATRDIRLVVEPAAPIHGASTIAEALEPGTGRLDVTRWTATDEADSYKMDAHPVPVLPEYGWISIPVLEFLNGRPWNNAALNVVHGLRPSAIRILLPTGGITADSVTWRVTVSLDADGRTIRKITQEVQVGLDGCRYGSDVTDFIDGRVPTPDLKEALSPEVPVAMVNPRALKRVVPIKTRP
jgi:hypothetical protein